MEEQSTDAPKQPQAGGNMGKSITRAIVAILAVAAIGAAGMDFMAKGQFEQSNKAVFDKLEGEGLPAADLADLIVGSPAVIGDPEKDTEVTYRWGLIRSYDLTLIIAGAGDQRTVVSILE